MGETYPNVDDNSSIHLNAHAFIQNRVILSQRFCRNGTIPSIPKEGITFPNIP